MTNTAFGPQGFNAATSLPAGTTNNRYGTGVDTWVKPASGPGECDGTVLDAAFFNTIIGNIRYVVQQSGVAMTDGDMTLLFDAIQAISPTYTTNDAITITGNTFDVALGNGTLTFFSA